jgi:hypothetical protein
MRNEIVRGVFKNPFCIGTLALARSFPSLHHHDSRMNDNRAYVSILVRRGTSFGVWEKNAIGLSRIIAKVCEKLMTQRQRASVSCLESH